MKAGIKLWHPATEPVSAGEVYEYLKGEVFINDKFVCEYLADGMIISTPTGSTAYNLSAGGPILYPDLEAITLVPICPHTITARPLVIPSSEKITVVPSSTQLKLHINADGQEVIDCYEKIDIKILTPHFNIYLFY